MAEPKRPLIIDHDAGVDDLAAIAIAYLSDRFQVHGITICPADSYRDPAVQITVALAKFLGIKDVPIATSNNEGKNLFPDKWRRDSVRLAQIDELKIDPAEYARYGFTQTPAAQTLVNLLSGPTKYEILATGPLSNIADAIKLQPKIAKNILKVYFMGGAFRVHGNVEAKGHDVSAEWNVYNNPEAVSTVLKAGVPVIFVPLDATNKAPVTRGFMKALAEQKGSRVSSLFQKVWSVIAAQIESADYQKTYFFWDTLTAAFAANGKLGKLTNDTIQVLESGPSEGRTLPDQKGYKVKALSDPDAKNLEKFILETLNK